MHILPHVGWDGSLAAARDSNGRSAMEREEGKRG
jgi:hypothetical protein